MAIYQSGSVAGVIALLETLKDFAIARGATNNNYAADGSGQKLHIKLGSGFFNFRALVNETHPGSFGAGSIFGIYAYGSTGYNGASPWNDQPGGPKYGTSIVYPTAGIAELGNTGTPSPTLNYHLFYADRPNQPKTLTVTGATNASPIVITANTHRLATGDRVSIAGILGNTAANNTWTVTKVNANSFSLDGSTGNGAYISGGTITLLSEVIYLIVEYPSGRYQHLLFGMLDKSECGEVSGGQFVAAHTPESNNIALQSISFFGRGIQFGFNTANTPPSMIYVTVDSLTGWKLSPNTNSQSRNGQQYCLDTVTKLRNRVNCAPNAFNSQTVLDPIGVAVTRDGANDYVSTTPWTIIGFLPELYYCNIRNLIPGSQYNIGSTLYRVFPMLEKSDLPYTIQDPRTQYFGIAIRSN